MNGASFGIFELYIFPGKIRRYNFLTILLIRSGFYIAIIFLIIFSVTLISRMLRDTASFLDTLYSDDFQEYLFEQDFFTSAIYAFLFIVLINFMRQMNKKMGQGTMISYVSGKYHRPKEEERVFMFLDLTASTRLAEKLGDLTFHKLLNDFYFDITKCILTTKGEIYRYVGDEIVVSWEKDNGIKNANCIRTYYYIIYELRKHREKYIHKYGFVPQFTASFHSGKVITGEIGEVKSQIVFHGEALYITSKVEKKCTELQKSILITEDLLQLLTIPPVYKVEECGKLDLATKDKFIRLYSLNEIDKPAN